MTDTGPTVFDDGDIPAGTEPGDHQATAPTAPEPTATPVFFDHDDEPTTKKPSLWARFKNWRASRKQAKHDRKNRQYGNHGNADNVLALLFAIPAFAFSVYAAFFKNDDTGYNRNQIEQIVNEQITARCVGDVLELNSVIPDAANKLNPEAICGQ